MAHPVSNLLAASKNAFPSASKLNPKQNPTIPHPRPTTNLVQKSVFPFVATTVVIVNSGYAMTHISAWIKMILHLGGSKLSENGWRLARFGIDITLLRYQDGDTGADGRLPP